MQKQILFNDGHYAIARFEGIPDEAIQFLDSIAWGSEGAVYEHKNTKEHIGLIPRPILLAIYEGDAVRGTAVFCHTPVAAGGKSYNCYYIRYFASSPAIRGKGVMKKISVEVMESIRYNESEKTIYFACVERANKSSYKVVQHAGYNKLGTVKTSGFSRFFPRAQPDLEQIVSPEARGEVLALLQEHYRPHTLVQFNSLFLHDHYFVIRKEGEIIAGCQYHRAHWVVNRMEGLFGKLAMNLAPRIPVLNKVFNPNRFEFLGFEGIYCKPGYEDSLAQLFEGLLARENLSSALYWMGATCPHRARIEEKVRPGLLHAFVKDSDAYVMAAFHGMEPAEIEDITERPLYASAFDYL